MDKHNKESERQKLKLAAATTSGAVSNEFLDESERLTPHATGNAEPKEWTNVYVEELWTLGGSILVRDAHNAALADERERNQNQADVLKRLGDMLGVNVGNNTPTIELFHALATESQRRQQAERVAQVCYDLHGALGIRWGDDPYVVINKLKSNLLSAQAAIENLQRVRENWAQNEATNVELQHAFKTLGNVDLSALREHDAEVRKPLVEALEEIAQCGYKDADTLRMIARDRIDALTKVKE